MYKNRIIYIFLLILIFQCSNPTEPEKLSPEHIGEPKSISELEQYMFHKVNEDRNKNNVPEVIWDEIVAKAGRKHAQEMVRYGYFSHWNLEGKKPCQRYTEAGGEDAVFENIWGYKLEPNKKYHDSSPCFEHVDKAEEDLMNSPLHRKNILDSCHTSVGIGIAKDSQGYIWICQEFVNDYGDYTKIPLEINVNDSVKIEGQMKEGYYITNIGIGIEELPKQMSVSELNNTAGYYIIPPSYPLFYYYGGYTKFSVTIKLHFIDKLNHIFVWTKINNKDVLISNRTIIVR